MRENTEIGQENGFAKVLYQVLGREIQNLFILYSGIGYLLPMFEESSKDEFKRMNVKNYCIAAGNMHCSLMEGWWTGARTESSYKRANKLADNRGEPT